MTATHAFPEPTDDAPPLDGYAPPPEFWDEYLDAQGQPRPHWQTLAHALANLGSREFSRRAEEMQRHVYENGVTYNVFSENRGDARPWDLDPLPMLVATEEWEALQAGLRQRVNLLNHVLSDLYGPQELLTSGALPKELVLANPAYLRPCHGFRPPGEIYLHVYAADLARSPDGQWWVLSDRAESPSGVGYALENREVSLRGLPEALGAVGVQRLRPFFRSMLKSFEGLVTRPTEHPQMVILSPGPESETYFEHAYLARSLGYPLVQGDDLTVRDQRVYLKTVSGLRPVDVIWRQLESSQCDPLELAPESMEGVPGLLEAARARQVVIANSLGSGLVESPAMPAFLPALAQKLLGQDLLLPSVASWWCGDEEPRKHVLANLENLVIKPTYKPHSSVARFGPQLSRRDRQRLEADIRSRPEQFCGQELVARATMPVWSPKGAQASHFLMRVFLVWTGQEYALMPGALTRITPGLWHFSVYMKEGGRAKDTWVLAGKENHGAAPATPANERLHLRRQTAELTSSDADNLFWMGRYLERTEAQARVLRLLLQEIQENSAGIDPGNVRPFVRALLPEFEPVALADGSLDAHALAAALEPFTLGTDGPDGLALNVQRLEQVAFAVKDRLSVETGGILTRLATTLSSEPSGRSWRSLGRRLDDVLVATAGLSGSIQENMTRYVDWRFLELGRRLERALFLLDLLTGAVEDRNQWSEGFLRNCLAYADSRYTYASRYLTHLAFPAVLDLLLTDETNPRGIAFQVTSLREHLDALPPAREEAPQPARKQVALRAYTALYLSDVDSLCTVDETGYHANLANFLGGVSQNLMSLADLLGQQYFAHSEPKSLSAHLP